MVMSSMARPPATSGVSSATLRAVRAGDEISVEVQGGFARRRAPTDGVIVQLPDKDVFVEVAVLEEALRTLGRLPAGGR
jgi:hypothetical protein